MYCNISYIILFCNLGRYIIHTLNFALYIHHTLNFAIITPIGFVQF